MYVRTVCMCSVVWCGVMGDVVWCDVWYVWCGVMCGVMCGVV